MHFFLILFRLIRGGSGHEIETLMKIEWNLQKIYINRQSIVMKDLRQVSHQMRNTNIFRLELLHSVLDEMKYR